MLLNTLHTNEQRLDYLAKQLSEKVDTDLDLSMQYIYSNHLVLAGAGFVENSVKEILYQYAQTRGDPRLASYISHTVSRYNSLNCEKISNILKIFDKKWWPTVEDKLDNRHIQAIDSLKTLRDSIAHGGRDGTGFCTVRGYCDEAKKFVSTLADVVHPLSSR